MTYTIKMTQTSQAYTNDHLTVVNPTIVISKKARPRTWIWEYLKFLAARKSL